MSCHGKRAPAPVLDMVATHLELRIWGDGLVTVRYLGGEGAPVALPSARLPRSEMVGAAAALDSFSRDPCARLPLTIMLPVDVGSGNVLSLADFRQGEGAGGDAAGQHADGHEGAAGTDGAHIPGAVRTPADGQAGPGPTPGPAPQIHGVDLGAADSSALLLLHSCPACRARLRTRIGGDRTLACTLDTLSGGRAFVFALAEIGRQG